MKRSLALSFALFSSLQSCKTAPSQVNHKLTKPGWLFITQIEDRLQFEYKSSSNGVTGGKVYRSVGVKMNLPLGLTHNRITDNNMTFYYTNNQSIFVKTLYVDNKKYVDTLYTLNQDMAETFIDDSVPTFSEEKKLRDTKFIQSRKTLIIKKGHILIFLYNIKKSRYEEFRNSALGITEY